MPILTGTVGQGGNNRVHDVAVIQAALTNANLPGAGRGFWQGRIDGRKSPALDEAICAFQQAARAQVTGRIAQSGADTNKLEGALPHTHKNMRAVASTAAVWRTNGRAKRFAEVAKAAEGAPFPKAERTALAAIAKRSAQSFGLGVELEDAAVTADGRFRARLGVPDIEWLDAGGTRFQKNGPVPAEVARNLARVAQGNPTWRAVAQPRDGALIELTSMRVYQPLHGAPVLTPEAMETFGLTARPTDQLSQTCIAGCARLLEGGLDDSNKDDFEAIVSVFDFLAPALGQRIRQSPIVLAQSQQTPVAGTPTAPHMSGNLAWPTDHLVVTDPFNSTVNRTDPHGGVDIRARLNDSIYAVEDGTVVGGYVAAGAGHVAIEYTSGGFGLYAHVSANVVVGQAVVAGEKIAISDQSGTRHAHLHYGYVLNGTVRTSGRVDGPRIDPIANQLGSFQYTN